MSTLLVWAELDVRSSLDVARQFEAALTDTELVVIPGPGHLSNLERPDAFNEAVREFCHAHQPSDVNVVGSSHVAIPGYGADGPQRRASTMRLTAAITPLHPGPLRFEGGLTEVGPGVHAWLQPNGLLGKSNAGLVVGDALSLLVDTLWDPRLTRRMLAAMAPLIEKAPIETLINTPWPCSRMRASALPMSPERR